MKLDRNLYGHRLLAKLQVRIDFKRSVEQVTEDELFIQLRLGLKRHPISLLSSLLFDWDIVGVQFVNMDRVNLPVTSFARLVFIPWQLLEGFVQRQVVPDGVPPARLALSVMSEIVSDPI